MELDRALVSENLPAEKGSYLLVLESVAQGSVRVGNHGVLEYRPGVYLYIGSAFGPGGLRARVSRHADRDKKQYWHIDYLRPCLKLRAVYFSTSFERLEDAWSEQIEAWPETLVPMEDFGATDRQRGTHLFYCVQRPGNISGRLQGGAEIRCLESI
jgi:Uri superfamily endonuclease